MRITILLSLLVFSSTVLAQRGVAPNGYYPASYRGDTFTGTVVDSDPATDSVILEFKKSSKPQVLSVRLEGGCSVPSKTGAPMQAKNIPKGTVLTAYYMGRTEKRGAEKQNVDVAIGISFVEWQGKPVSELNRRRLYSCGAGGGWDYFRAFANGEPGAIAISPLELTKPRP